MTPNQMIEYVRSRAALKAEIEADILKKSVSLMEGYKVLVGLFSEEDTQWVRGLLINWGWEVRAEIEGYRAYDKVWGVYIRLPKEIRDALPETTIKP